MKKFKLDLSKYDVTFKAPTTNESGEKVMGDVTEPYPLRDNLSEWLRGLGIFKCAEDVAEAVFLARRIRECEDDCIELDEREARVLKTATNRLLELTTEFKANLGGPTHEEAICRVVKMEEIK